IAAIVTSAAKSAGVRQREASAKRTERRTRVFTDDLLIIVARGSWQFRSGIEATQNIFAGKPIRQPPDVRSTLERSSLSPSPPVRVRHRLPLPLPGPDDGAGPADRGDESPGAPDRGGALERRCAVLDPHLRDQLRRRRGYGDSDGIPVRHELGAVLALRRQRR